MQLPSQLTISEFDQQFRLKPELWQAAVIECCDLHGLPSVGLKAFKDGTNLVAMVNDQHIVKIFPPFLKHQWESEHRVLKHLYGKIEIEIPELIASGVRADQWPYVIISKLEGATFESNWTQFSDSDKIHVLKQIGKIMRSVHQVDVSGLQNIEPNWSVFYKAQAEKALARHQRLNAPPWFLRELPSYLKSTQDLLPERICSVILTGEYTPFNLMTPNITTAQVTGMIDFGDAMIGFHEYDLLGPSVFMAEGKVQLIHALLDGYGLPAREINSNLKQRLMRLLILHRYSNLPLQIRIADWEKRTTTINELADLIWPF